MAAASQETHNRILDDIYLKTGLRYRHIQGADTRQEAVAKAVLRSLQNGFLL